MNNAAEAFRIKQVGYLPDRLKFDWIDVREGFARGRFDVAKQHLAPNGYLHAATVVALADTACGYGCMTSLPKGASGFTTIELKANFLGTALEGGVICEARIAARRPHDAGLGRGGEERDQRQDDCAVSLYSNSSLSKRAAASKTG